MKSLVSKTVPLAYSVIHPLLFAIFPVISLYSHNIDETTLNQIVMPMLLSTLGALVLWLVWSVLLRSTLKAGLATTILIIIFFFYGRVYDLLAKWDLSIVRHAYLFPAALLVWAYCAYFIFKATRGFRSTTRILNVVAVVLVGLNLLTIAFHQARTPKPALVTGIGTQVVTAETGLDGSGPMPDIYYIILDEYAHPDTMLEYYQYDNSRFIDGLLDKGFYVAPNSRTMYPLTNWSIATSLNMEYMPAGASQEFCFSRMANNKVVNYLKSIGYSYVYSGVWFEQDEVCADLYYNFYKSSDGDTVVSQFSRTLWNTTMARPFYDYLTGSVVSGHCRSSIMDQIQCLKSMPDVEGPKFVLTHVICPHAPLVFGPNGEYIDPLHSSDFQDKQYYLGQYKFISKQIKSVVATLLEKSEVDPIIILQSDHGLRVHEGKGIPVPDSEWHKILNAYHLPGDGEQVLYDSISPVNSFRVIFNHYFGTDYDMLQDPQPAKVAD